MKTFSKNLQKGDFGKIMKNFHKNLKFFSKMKFNKILKYLRNFQIFSTFTFLIENVLNFHKKLKIILID